MKRHLAALALIALLPACHVEPAVAAPPPRDAAIAEVATCQANHKCYTLGFSRVSDAAGAADRYRVVVSAPGLSIDSIVTGPPLAFSVACTPGASGSITAKVWSIRRDSVSKASANATANYLCADIPPPAPGSVIISPDTVASAPPLDSTAIAELLVLPSNITVAVGDSVLVHAIRVDLAGRRSAARPPVEWNIGATDVVEIHPVPGTADAWVIGKRCTGCSSAFVLPRFHPYSAGT